MLSEAKRSVAWSGIQQTLVLGVQLGVGIILARLLTPYDYGVVTLQAVFFAIVTEIIGSGMEGALIQKRECTKDDENSAFIFNLTLSLILYAVLFLAAPLIEKFYNIQNLQKVIRVSSLALIIYSIGVVPYSLLQRRLQFKRLAFVSAIATTIAGTSAVIMAYSGYAYWALVWYSLLTASLMTFAYFICAKWYPQPKFSHDSFRQLISFGLPMMFSSVLNSVYNNLYSIVIGKAYNARQLGLYNRASSYAGFLPYSLSDFSMRALYPILSKSQDDQNILKSKGLDILHLSAFFAFPICLFMVVSVDELIKVLLTEKWMMMAPLMKILCISGLSYVITNLHTNLFKAIGRTNILFKCELWKKIVGITVLFATYRYGLITMAWGVLACGITNVLISSFFLYRNLGITLLEQAKQLYVVIFNATMAFVVCFLMKSVIVDSYLFLLFCFVVYPTVFLLLSWMKRDQALTFFNVK